MEQKHKFVQHNCAHVKIKILNVCIEYFTKTTMDVIHCV